MEICIEEKIPGFVVSSGFMFAHPSLLSDLYHPEIERIYLPEEQISPHLIHLRVKSGCTGPGKNESFKWRFYQKALNLFKEEAVIDLSDKFVFDARNDVDTNIAHVIRCAVGVLFAKKTLSYRFDKDVQIQVVLRQRASSMSRKVFANLGLPIICTDGDVYGEIVENSKQLQFEKYLNLFPELLNFKFADYNAETPERVFIPRRGARKLINNDEVVDFFESQGFKTIYFEDLPISEAWSIARNAKVAAIVHGASYAHFRFNRVGLETPEQGGSGLKFLDIFSPNFTIPRSTRPFIASVNGRWAAVRGEIQPKNLCLLDKYAKENSLHPLRKPVKAPFRVDIKSLEMALEYLHTTESYPAYPIA